MCRYPGTHPSVTETVTHQLLEWRFGGSMWTNERRTAVEVAEEDIVVNY